MDDSTSQTFASGLSKSLAFCEFRALISSPVAGINVLVIIFSAALLFSATFKKKVEMLCRDILTDPIRVVVGELGEVSHCCWSK